MTAEPPSDPAAIDMDAWVQHPGAMRAVNAFTIELVVSFMTDAARLFESDYVAALIFFAVVEANGRLNRRDASFTERFPDPAARIPLESNRPLSRQAIAASLGLSRETVRRKITALVDKGYLVSAASGVVVAREILVNPDFLAAQQRVVTYVRRFRADLILHAGAPTR